MQIVSQLFAQETAILEQFNKKKFYNRHCYKYIPTDQKLVGCIGLRGVGKTSYLLSQRIKAPKSMYISCDSPYLNGSLLLDIVTELVKGYGIQEIFLDEIQVLQNRAQQLKSIYDTIDVKVTFSGSNTIDIKNGSFDLSRRVLIAKVPSFSFREYVEITQGIKIAALKINQMIHDHIEYARQASRYSPVFLKDYMRQGEFGYRYEGSANISYYQQRVAHMIEKVIYSDLIQAIDISSNHIHKLQDMIYYIVSSSSSDTSIQTISQKVGLSHQTTQQYLYYLKQAGLVEILDFHGSITERVKKQKKIFVPHPNIASLYTDNIGILRESFVMQHLQRIDSMSFFHAPSIDIIAFDGAESSYSFEIGGKSKKAKTGIYMIQDNINIGTVNSIPLWIIGMLE